MEVQVPTAEQPGTSTGLALVCQDASLRSVNTVGDASHRNPAMPWMLQCGPETVRLCPPWQIFLSLVSLLLSQFLNFVF